MRDYLPPAVRTARLELMKEIAVGNGGICTADEYVHCNVPLTFSCPQHGTFSAQPRHIAAGGWCRKCRDDARKPPVIERLQNYVSERGGRIMSEYLSARKPIVIECPLHGNWVATPDNLLNKKSWCKRCASGKPRQRRKKVNVASRQQGRAKKR